MKYFATFLFTNWVLTGEGKVNIVIKFNWYLKNQIKWYI